MNVVKKYLWSKSNGTPPTRVAVKAYFTPTEEGPDPSEKQVMNFLASRTHNVVLPPKTSIKAVMKTIRKHDIIHSHLGKKWMKTILRELTGSDLAKLKKKKLTSSFFQLKTIKGTVHLNFEFELPTKKIKEELGVGPNNSVRNAIKEEMNIRADKSIWQNVFFNYRSANGRWMQAVLKVQRITLPTN
jgi:hypothetical protein